MIECLLQMRFFIIQTRKGLCSTHSPFHYYIMNPFTNHRKVLNVDLQYAYHFANCIKCNRHAVNHLNTGHEVALRIYKVCMKLAISSKHIVNLEITSSNGLTSCIHEAPYRSSVGILDRKKHSRCHLCSCSIFLYEGCTVSRDLSNALERSSSKVSVGILYGNLCAILITYSRRYICCSCADSNSCCCNCKDMVSGESDCPYCTEKRLDPNRTSLKALYPDIAEMWSSKNK